MSSLQDFQQLAGVPPGLAEENVPIDDEEAVAAVMTERMWENLMDTHGQGPMPPDDLWAQSGAPQGAPMGGPRDAPSDDDDVDPQAMRELMLTKMQADDDSTEAYQTKKQKSAY